MLSCVAASESASKSPQRKTCVVKASGSNLTDDAPAIRKAFQKCGRHGTIDFLKKTYYVNTVLNTTGLEDVEINLRGTLLVSDLLPIADCTS